MHASIPTTYISLVFLCVCVCVCVCFFFFFFSTSPSFCSSPLFTIHSYPFLYHLPWWDLPFLPLNYSFFFSLFFLCTSPSFRSSPSFHFSQLPLFIPFAMVGFTIFTPQILLTPYECPSRTVYWPAGGPATIST